MKRSKRLIVLSGILAAGCAATYGVMAYEEQKELIKNSDEIIMTLDPETVTGLSWEYGTEYLKFQKKDSEESSESSDVVWTYDEDEAFPVSQEKISEMLGIFEEFGVSFIIEEVEDFSQYGLDDPVCTIDLKTEEKDYEILLGDFSTMDSERYVSIGDGNVYLVKQDPFETFEVTISDMIDHDEFPYFYDVQKITVAGKENYTIQYQEDGGNTYREDDMYFVETAEDSSHADVGDPLDTVRVDCYLEVINHLDPENYVTYNATEEELEQYGMTAPELTVSVDHSWEDSETEETMEDTFVLHVSRNPEDAEKADEKAEEAEEADEDAPDSDDEEIPAYVRVGDSPIIYEIPQYRYEDLIAVSFDDLRHQEVLPALFTDIDQIDISLEGSDYIIETSGTSAGRVYKYQGEELEIEVLQTAMDALTASEFTDEEPSGKEEISLKIRLDLEGDPEVQITFYRHDGEHCLMTMDGEPISLVERNLVVDLMEAIYTIVLE